jgi:hypothetical protein
MKSMADTEIPKDKTEFRYFIVEVIETLTALLEEKDRNRPRHITAANFGSE